MEKILNQKKNMKKNIEEKVKTRRQNKETDRDTQRTFASSSPPKKDCKKFNDEYDSNRWSSGYGLKILTNKQMLNRLPILLAQIQAGGNSKELKNEMRQILYSLYRSKVLTKTVYNNLIKSIRA